MLDQAAQQHVPEQAGEIESHTPFAFHKPRVGRIAIFCLFHLGAIVALANRPSVDVVIATLGMFVISGCFGITLCYHRLLAHASYKTFRWLSRLLAVCGTLTWFGGPLDWVGVHRRHHAHPDESPDPHTPLAGFWWAHFDWFFEAPGYEVGAYAHDVARDSWMGWIDRFHYLPAAASFVALYVVGEYAFAHGVEWLLWAGCFRTVAVFHAAGLVNSWAHTWGQRAFDTADRSRNSPIVAAVTFGEGWHNNHHASHRCAAHGRSWRQPDPTYWVICAMEKLGLAWDVVHPNTEPDRRALRALTTDDMDRVSPACELSACTSGSSESTDHARSTGTVIAAKAVKRSPD